MQQDPLNTANLTDSQIADKTINQLFENYLQSSPEVLGIRIFKNGSTQDVEAAFCQYMYIGELRGIPGVFYKLAKDKMPIPVSEIHTFVPLHTLVQLFLKDPNG